MENPQNLNVCNAVEYGSVEQCCAPEVFSEGAMVEEAAAHGMAIAPTSIVVTVAFNINAPGIVPPPARMIPTGSALGSLPAPLARPGYNFNGWWTAPVGGTQWMSNTPVWTNTVLFAQWTSVPLITVHFFADGGSVTPSSRDLTAGSSVGILPTPTRTGYNFSGWVDFFTQQPVSNNTVMWTSTILTATWRPAIVPIFFNPSGGSVVPTNRLVQVGTAIGTLPTPTQQPSRNGYTFLGWFDSAGQQVFSSTIMFATATLTARWEAPAPPALDPVRMMNNVANDATLRIESADRREAMVVVGRTLLANGYEPAFAAGMMANVMREGNFGQFEGAGNQAYLQYFITNHNYVTRFSRQHLYNVDITLQELRRMTENAPNPTNIFGLGILQWTNRPRFFSLLNQYEIVSGGTGRITRDQVVEAETRQMMLELPGHGMHTGPHPIGGGWGFNLPAFWRTHNQGNLLSEQAAGHAGELITLAYTRPAQTQDRAFTRKNDAIDIFRVMMR